MIQGLLVAFDDKLVIHPLKDSMISPGGIIKPDTARQREDQGIIVSKGQNVSAELEIGDHVCFSPYSGDKVPTENGEFFIIREPQVSIKLNSKAEKAKFVTTKRIREIAQNRLLVLRATNPIGYYAIEEAYQNIIEELEALPYSEGFEF